MQLKFLKKHTEAVTPLTSVTFDEGHVLDVPGIDEGIQAMIDAGVVEVYPAPTAVAGDLPDGDPAITRTYADMTVAELRAAAEAANVPQASKLKKAELITALNALTA